MLTKGQSKILYLNIPKSQRETALDLDVRQTHISLLGSQNTRSEHPFSHLPLMLRKS